MYVSTKIGQIQSNYQNFDIAIIEKVANVFPIKNVHFHVYFNIPIDVRIHKNKPNSEHLSEFRYCNYLKVTNVFSIKNVHFHVYFNIPIHVRIQKNRPNSEHLSEFRYCNY